MQVSHVVSWHPNLSATAGLQIHTIPSYFCLVYGITVTILGSIGGLRGIIVSASGAPPAQRLPCCTCLCFALQAGAGELITGSLLWLLGTSRVRQLIPGKS